MISSIRELGLEIGLLAIKGDRGIIPKDDANYFEAGAILNYITNRELLKDVKPEDARIWAQLGRSMLRKIEAYAEKKGNESLYTLHADLFNRRIRELGLETTEGESA